MTTIIAQSVGSLGTESAPFLKLNKNVSINLVCDSVRMRCALKEVLSLLFAGRNQVAVQEYLDEMCTYASNTYLGKGPPTGEAIEIRKRLQTSRESCHVLQLRV